MWVVFRGLLLCCLLMFRLVVFFVCVSCLISGLICWWVLGVLLICIVVGVFCGLVVWCVVFVWCVVDCVVV